MGFLFSYHLFHVDEVFSDVATNLLRVHKQLYSRTEYVVEWIIYTHRERKKPLYTRTGIRDSRQSRGDRLVLRQPSVDGAVGELVQQYSEQNKNPLPTQVTVDEIFV